MVRRALNQFNDNRRLLNSAAICARVAGSATAMSVPSKSCRSSSVYEWPAVVDACHQRAAAVTDRNGCRPAVSEQEAGIEGKRSKAAIPVSTSLLFEC